MHSNMSPLMHRHSLVPPGFRFHPTDQELVGYYLQKKVASKRIDLDVIREIDLYKMEPWDLQERCMTGSPEQTDWYFFSHKDKKYPTGTRTNRATAAGFWKATGRDKAIRTTYKVIGMRKTLVFYKGRAPNGQKTDWIMHEYRLEDDENNSGSLEDGWVVCRVFRKSNTQRTQDDISSCRETQQALMFDLPSNRNSYASSSDKTKMVHSFAYKQMAPQTADGCGTSHDVFLQLPDLESPKVHSSLAHFGTKDVPSSNSSNMRNNNCPSPFSLTTTEFEVPEVKSVVTQEMHDWRMDNTQRNSRFQNVDPTNNDQFGDLGLILRFNKERPNYSSNSDIQFWNAPR